MTTDDLENPSHYRKGGVAQIDVAEAWQLDYHLGTALEYICRSGLKHRVYSREKEIEDLEKAEWWIRRKLNNLKGEEQKDSKPSSLDLGEGMKKVMDEIERDRLDKYADMNQPATAPSMKPPQVPRMHPGEER